MKEDEALRKAETTAQATAIINQLVPVGTVISYAGNSKTLPPGWLPCDGSTFNQNQYPELYTALGNSNALPNLAGYFLRGLDTSGKVDPDGAGRALLSLQADAFAQHSHITYQAPWYDSEPFSGGNDYRSSAGYTNFRHQEASSTVGGSETRPKNAAVLYLIFAGLPQQ